MTMIASAVPRSPLRKLVIGVSSSTSNTASHVT
jgi:hypothetical protein